MYWFDLVMEIPYILVVLGESKDLGDQECLFEVESLELLAELEIFVLESY